VTTVPNAFWDDLAADLRDPELRHHYILESQRIAAIDRIINQLDELREREGLTKADLARAIECTPETVRRLLTSKSVNPQFGVIAELAAVLGFRITLEPMSPEERKQIAEPLRKLATDAA
jgi:DNA-binding XRE family transcriptional regulator